MGWKEKIDINSPADGYFEQRDIPRQTFVENSETQILKEREAAAEQAQARHPLDAQTNTQQPRSTRWADEAIPLLDVGQAPPDYESATAGQRQQQQDAFRPDHPLVRNGLLRDQGVFDSRTRPQSMQHPAPAQTSTAGPERGTTDDRDYAAIEEQADEQTSLLGGPRKGKLTSGRRGCSSPHIKACIFAIVVLLLAIIAITTTVMANRKKDSSSGKKPSGPSPSLPKGPVPAHPSRLGRCELNSFSATESFNFTDSANEGFEFLESIDHINYDDIFPQGAMISGTLRIAPALQEQENGGPDIQAWVNVATTAPLTIPQLMYSRGGNSLELHFPYVEYNEWRSGQGACFDISVAIHVRKGTRIKKWTTSTANMQITVNDGLFGQEEPGSEIVGPGITVEKETSFFAQKGNVEVAYWDSRRTVIETNSGRIEGTFALRDLLKLTSNSGRIQAHVDPKEADPDDSVPAEFIMKAISGGVHADFPTEASHGRDLPDRDYQTRVETNSGRLGGTYILGKSAKFKTNSASIEVDVLPFSADMPSSSLSTENLSGRTELVLLEPYHSDYYAATKKDHRKGVMDALKSHHQSNSGSIEVTYPQAWEGAIDAKSISGHIELRGEDVEMFSNLTDIAAFGNHVVARKGSGDSEVKFKTNSGSIEALFGDD